MINKKSNTQVNKDQKQRKVLRKGYTTGACAAAAAKAAALSLLHQEPVNKIMIPLPKGNQVHFKIDKCSYNNTVACCSVIKDAGDDPDITDGAEIYAEACWTDQPGVTVTGGKGVGTITKPGLEMPIGSKAINPVPQRMIEQSVQQAMGNILDSRGVRVTISVPCGEQLTLKTLNSRLGISGGISILGTTGVVIPYSISAYKTCISQAIDIAAASDCRQIVLTTGRRSEKYAQSELALVDECYIQAGDFIGYSLKKCAAKNIEKVIIWGMIGKLSKLAAGYLYTNVSDSKIDINFLAKVAVGCSIPNETIKELRTAVTANHFRRILPAEYTRAFCDRICLLAAVKCQEKVSNAMKVECIMSSFDGMILGRSNDPK